MHKVCPPKCSGRHKWTDRFCTANECFCTKLHCQLQNCCQYLSSLLHLWTQVISHILDHCPVRLNNRSHFQWVRMDMPPLLTTVSCYSHVRMNQFSLISINESVISNQIIMTLKMFASSCDMTLQHSGGNGLRYHLTIVPRLNPEQLVAVADTVAGSPWTVLPLGAG